METNIVNLDRCPHCKSADLLEYWGDVAHGFRYECGQCGTKFNQPVRMSETTGQSAKSEIERLRTINADLMEALCEFMDDAYLDNGTLCGWCGYRTEVGSGHLHNRVCRVGKAEAAIAKAEGR